MDKLWWSTIPNARKFVDDIAEELINGKSAVYSVNGTLPWSYTFTGILSSKIESSEQIVDIINAEDIGEESPGEFLFKKYCKPELRAKYRSSMGYDRFLAVNDRSTILLNRYIYVRNSDRNAVKQWVEFICKYNGYHEKSSPRCCFIIENCSDLNPGCGITNFQWDSYYHQYDISTFCLLNASSIKENDLIKSYLAELSCTLSHNDVEFAAELVSTGTNLISNTETVVKNIVENNVRSDYAAYVMPGNIATCIKEAQVKIFYPIIERFRSWFINENIDQFTDGFKHITAFGETITDCHDLELGDLVYLCKNAKLSVDYDKYKELTDFHKYRNDLAHRTLLPEESIRKLSNYIVGTL